MGIDDQWDTFKDDLCYLLGPEWKLRFNDVSEHFFLVSCHFCFTWTYLFSANIKISLLTTGISDPECSFSSLAIPSSISWIRRFDQLACNARHSYSNTCSQYLIIAEPFRQVFCIARNFLFKSVWPWCGYFFEALLLYPYHHFSVTAILGV